MTTPVNLAAISAMGSQFNKNIFDKPVAKSKGLLHKQAKAAHAARVNAANTRERFAQSAEGMVNQGRRNFAQQQQQKVKTAQAAAKAHAAQVKKGRAAPAPGSAPRTFAMPAGPQGVQQRAQASQAAKNTASQVNAAHGAALKEATDRAKVMQQQRNFAHGEAIKEASRRTKEAQKGASPTPKRATPQAPTSGIPNIPGGPMQRTAAPGPVPQAAQGAQFVNVQAQSNDPHPTHQHPQGSSNMKLGNLSASQPRPNDFTVGSRNVKPGGIAARGSQLEAWGIAKQKAVQARTASRRAGGRDKNLATEAKKAENFANQPLNRFAPHTAD